MPSSFWSLHMGRLCITFSASVYLTDADADSEDIDDIDDIDHRNISPVRPIRPLRPLRPLPTLNSQPPHRTSADLADVVAAILGPMRPRERPHRD